MRLKLPDYENHIMQLRSPHVHVVSELTPELSTLIQNLQNRRFSTFEIDGQQATTYEDFHRRCKEIFQFFNLYGENWNAYFDMMIDFDWHQFAGIFTVVRDAEHLLRYESEEKRTFFRVQNNISKTWAAGQHVNANLTGRCVPFYTLMISKDRHFMKQFPPLQC